MQRGNTLLGTLLIVLFLGGLVLFSLVFGGAQKVSFLNEKRVSPLTFPLKKKFKLITRNGSKVDSISLEELFEDRSDLIINFWATWCPPCLEELPSLEYFGRQLNDKASNSLPRLVTFSADEAPEDVLKLFKTFDYSPSLIVLHDAGGELALSLGTNKFPETYWIDKQGSIKKKWVGPQNWLAGNIIQTLAP